MGQTYVVRAGDTFGHIATRHGITLAALIGANPQIKNPDRIGVGDRITIPGAAAAKRAKPDKPKKADKPATYAVTKGDTLGKIGARFGVSVERLLAANPKIKDRNVIRPGQVLTIPGSAATSTGAAASVTVTKPKPKPKPKPKIVLPPPPPEQYVVRQGDTLGKIATAFRVSVDQILAVNPRITNKNLIRPGQVITVPGKSSAMAVTDPGGTSGEPKWLTFARRELGTAEIAGGRHNRRILEYHATTTLKAKADEVHWCSSFVNWCIRQSGRKGTDSARARDWLKWGKPLSSPRLGAITVFARGGGGHVGFFLEDRGSTIFLLGGNQSDKVSKSSYKKANFLGYRWPAG